MTKLITLYCRYNDKLVLMCYSRYRIEKGGLDVGRAGKEKVMLSRSFIPGYEKQAHLEALKIYQSFHLLCFYRMERKRMQNFG